MLSVIVKRKYIRSLWIERQFGLKRATSCERRVTATFSDVFEANGLSIDDIGSLA